MIAGSKPTIPHDTMRARGWSPSDLARLADLMTTAAAPSTTPDAFPAVTSEFGPKCVLSPDSVSTLVHY